MARPPAPPGTHYADIGAYPDMLIKDSDAPYNPAVAGPILSRSVIGKDPTKLGREEALKRLLVAAEQRYIDAAGKVAPKPGVQVSSQDFREGRGAKLAGEERVNALRSKLDMPTFDTNSKEPAYTDFYSSHILPGSFEDKAYKLLHGEVDTAGQAANDEERLAAAQQYAKLPDTVRANYLAAAKNAGTYGNTAQFETGLQDEVNYGVAGAAKALGYDVPPGTPQAAPTPRLRRPGPVKPPKVDPSTAPVGHAFGGGQGEPEGHLTPVHGEPLPHQSPLQHEPGVPRPAPIKPSPIKRAGGTGGPRQAPATVATQAPAPDLINDAATAPQPTLAVKQVAPTQLGGTQVAQAGSADTTSNNLVSGAPKLSRSGRAKAISNRRGR